MHFYPTQLVTDWLAGTVPNDGVAITEPTPVADKIGFISTNSSMSQYWPSLSISYQTGQGEQPYYTETTAALTDRAHLHVNVAHGNTIIHAADVHIAGNGLDLDVARYYNSQWIAEGPLGRRWRLSVGKDVEFEPYGDGSIGYLSPGGTAFAFIKSGPSSWRTPPGINADLRAVDADTFTLSFHRTGEVDTFSDLGQCCDYFRTQQKDRDGDHIDYAFDSNRDLTSITDTEGRVLTVGYNTTGLISGLTDSTGRTWSYGYDTGALNLTSATDPAGKVSTYAYNGSHDPTKITDPLGNITTASYDGDDRPVWTTRVTNPATLAGNKTTYAYAATPAAACAGVGATQSTTITDPNSHASTYCADYRDRVLKSVDPLGHTRSTGYTGNDDVASATDALGNVTTFSHDGKDNLTAVALPTGASSTLAYADPAHLYLPARSPTRRATPPNTLTTPRAT